MTTQAHTGTNLRGLRILAPLGIGLITLFGLALATDGDITDVLRGADLTWVALAALKAPCLLLLWTLRWHLVLRSRRFPVRFGQTLSATLVRIFFNNLTPGFGTGGEPAATSCAFVQEAPQTFVRAPRVAAFAHCLCAIKRIGTPGRGLVPLCARRAVVAASWCALGLGF